MDASVVISGLTEATPAGDWARKALGLGRLAAPQLMPAEVCHVLRRRVAGGVLSAADASVGVRELVGLRAELQPFEPFAERVWELRDTVTIYDAWYVAMAEALDVRLVTLDSRLARAPGPRCEFLLPGVA